MAMFEFIQLNNLKSKENCKLRKPLVFEYRERISIFHVNPLLRGINKYEYVYKVFYSTLNMFMNLSCLFLFTISNVT